MGKHRKSISTARQIFCPEFLYNYDGVKNNYNILLHHFYFIYRFTYQHTTKRNLIIASKVGRSICVSINILFIYRSKTLNSNHAINGLVIKPNQNIQITE